MKVAGTCLIRNSMDSIASTWHSLREPSLGYFGYDMGVVVGISYLTLLSVLSRLYL